MIINRFRGDYAFLSNFSDSPMMWDGYNVSTAEHAYQLSKTDIISEKANIASSKTPAIAKTLGREVTLKKNWDENKNAVMYNILLAKFKDKRLAKKLLDTKDYYLCEGNMWHDNHFGVCHCASCPGIGANWLGKLLMEVRKTL